MKGEVKNMSYFKNEKWFQHYIDGLTEIESNQESLTEFLNLYGRFYKLGTAEVIGIYSQNKNAEMLADYHTWQKYGRQVQRGEKGIAVTTGGKTRHLFALSQTSGEKRPYQWGVDKETAGEVVDSFNKNGRAFKSFTRCIESLTRENVSKRIDSFFSESEISLSRQDFKTVISSIDSIALQIVGARCAYNGSYKYKGVINLSAFKLLTKDSNNLFLPVLQLASEAARETLREIEKTITKINTVKRERSDSHDRQGTQNSGRAGVPVGRGEREVATGAVYGREGNRLPARPRNNDLSATADLHDRPEGTGVVGTTAREIRQGVDETHAGEPQRGSGNDENQLPVGNHSAENRQGSVGHVLPDERAVSETESVPAREQFRGNEQIQRNNGLLPEQRSDEGRSASAPDSVEQNTAAVNHNGGISLPGNIETHSEKEKIEPQNEQLTLFGDDVDIIPEESAFEINNTITEPLKPKADNYKITDSNLGAGGQKTKYKNNIAAIKLLKTLESESRGGSRPQFATPDEKDVLAWYVGWGGIPEVFDKNKSDWNQEYAELKELLTEDEYRKAQASVLNAHYTSPEVIEAMYTAIESMGVTSNSKILEPAMGVGNFFGLLPDSMRNADLYGVELDDLTGRIAKQLYPDADIKITGFEEASFPDNYFDVVLGNVPFGVYL